MAMDFNALLVGVNFRGLMQELNVNPATAYVYAWQLPVAPVVGMRVWVQGSDGPASAIICEASAALPAGYTRAQLERVLRLATEEDIANARANWLAERNAWVDMVRHAAGLPTAAAPRTITPDGFDDVPPARGVAPKQEANRYGRAWWSIYKTAEREGWTDQEVARYREIAEHWFAVRDAQN